MAESLHQAPATKLTEELREKLASSKDKVYENTQRLINNQAYMMLSKKVTPFQQKAAMHMKHIYETPF